MIALECLPLNDASTERKGTVSFVFNISLLSSINLEASSKVLFISILFFSDETKEFLWFLSIVKPLFFYIFIF